MEEILRENATVLGYNWKSKRISLPLNKKRFSCCKYERKLFPNEKIALLFSKNRKDFFRTEYSRLHILGQSNSNMGEPSFLV